jgi:hypothetical protein
LEAKVGAPFEKEERYHKPVARQSEIEEQFDLTNNQAPSKVDAAATYESEENSEKQTETKSIQQTRRVAVRVNRNTTASKGLTLDVKSSAVEFGVCEETVRRLVRRKILRKLSGLRRILIPKSELQRYLSAQ